MFYSDRLAPDSNGIRAAVTFELLVSYPVIIGPGEGCVKPGFFAHSCFPQVLSRRFAKPYRFSLAEILWIKQTVAILSQLLRECVE